MRVAFIVAVFAVGGCSTVDDWLGSSDEEAVRITVADAQPTVPANGILVDISVFATSSGMLSVHIEGGTIAQGVGQAASASFCSPVDDPKQVLLPVIVVPAATEAVLEAQLLDVDSDHATVCDGKVRQATTAIVVQHPTVTVDGGVQ